VSQIVFPCRRLQAGLFPVIIGKKPPLVSCTVCQVELALLQTAQLWPIRTGTQALMCFQTFVITSHLSRIYRGMFHSKSAREINWNWKWYKTRRSATRPPSFRPRRRTPPPHPPPPPPIPPPVTIAGALLDPPIVGVCPPLARTECFFEVCGVGALRGVGFNLRGGRGGGGRGGPMELL